MSSYFIPGIPLCGEVTTVTEKIKIQINQFYGAYVMVEGTDNR